MKPILVIGATGNVGGHVVSQLLAKGLPVRPMVRRPHAAHLGPAVEVVQGDLTVPESVEAALRGVETVFLVWLAPPPAIAPALETITRHARRVVYLSAPIKTPHPFFQQPNLGRRMNEQIEGIIESSGIEWTFVRPGMFDFNSIEWWSGAIRSGAVIRWPYLEVETAPIHSGDIAAVAVRALCDDGHNRAEYVITGPESLTQRQQIETIGRAIGRTVPVEEISPDQAKAELSVLLQPAIVPILLDAWGAAVGLRAHVTNTVEEVTGKRARSYYEWAVENAAHFKREIWIDKHCVSFEFRG